MRRYLRIHLILNSLLPSPVPAPYLRTLKILRLYSNAFGGLSASAWMLSLIMLINRSGSMVIPFMSVYLTDELGFSVKDTGLLLSFFGIGSMAGSVLGGWLTDRIGQFKVQFGSLFFAGLFFFALPYITGFYWLGISLFLLSLIADTLRPANSASIALYARPENITRAFSLNRMAVNLGFSVGPALGGVLAAISYKFLFWADGFSCIGAGLLFYFYFRKKPVNISALDSEEYENTGKSAWTDMPFLFFCLLCSGFAMLFFQIFSSLPLYYREVYSLPEGTIGLLLGLNGLIVFIFEMVLVYKLGNKFPMRKLIAFGTLLAGLSFLILNFTEQKAILFLAMIVLSFAEIFAMPFMVTYTVSRSGSKNRGSYMGLYSLSYAIAFVLAPFLGTRIISGLGYENLWWIAGGFSVLVASAFYFAVPPAKNKPGEMSF